MELKDKIKQAIKREIEKTTKPKSPIVNESILAAAVGIGYVASPLIAMITAALVRYKIQNDRIMQAWLTKFINDVDKNRTISKLALVVDPKNTNHLKRLPEIQKFLNDGMQPVERDLKRMANLIDAYVDKNMDLMLKDKAVYGIGASDKNPEWVKKTGKAHIKKSMKTILADMSKQNKNKFNKIAKTISSSEDARVIGSEFGKEIIADLF